MEAIVGVASATSAKCDGTTEASNISWSATLVHTKNHLDFIHDQLKLWPYTVQTCTQRATTPDGKGTKTVEECWGKPCTLDSGCQKDVETCQGSPRMTLDNLPSPEPMCRVCIDYRHVDFDDNQLCDCIEGQCIPKLSPMR